MSVHRPHDDFAIAGLREIEVGVAAPGLAASAGSVSLILTVSDTLPELGLVDRMIVELDRFFSDVEIVIVANNPPPAVGVALKALCDSLPDCLLVFLAEGIHDDVARLVGIDHAVSDHLLFATPLAEEVNAVEAMVGEMGRGFELVVGRPAATPRRSLVNRTLFGAFQRLFQWSTGLKFEADPPAFRLLSRAAALFIATRREGEILVRSRDLGAGFPSAEIALPEEAGTERERRGFRHDFARGSRFITTGTTTWLRVSGLIALLGGIASAIYAAYVVLIYLLLPEVQPGWATMSLQLAGMMFLFSLQFLLLSEHVAQLSPSSGLSKRRHHVVREIRSTRSRRNRRLNVVDDQGRFTLGAPV